MTSLTIIQRSVVLTISPKGAPKIELTALPRPQVLFAAKGVQGPPGPLPNATQLISSDSENALTLGLDGKLVVAGIALSSNHW